MLTTIPSILTTLLLSAGVAAGADHSRTVSTEAERYTLHYQEKLLRHWAEDAPKDRTGLILRSAASQGVELEALTPERARASVQARFSEQLLENASNAGRRRGIFFQAAACGFGSAELLEVLRERLLPRPDEVDRRLDALSSPDSSDADRREAGRWLSERMLEAESYERLLTLAGDPEQPLAARRFALEALRGRVPGELDTALLTLALAPGQETALKKVALRLYDPTVRVEGHAAMLRQALAAPGVTGEEASSLMMAALRYFYLPPGDRGWLETALLSAESPAMQHALLEGQPEGSGERNSDSIAELARRIALDETHSPETRFAGLSRHGSEVDATTQAALALQCLTESRDPAFLQLVVKRVGSRTTYRDHPGLRDALRGLSEADDEDLRADVQAALLAFEQADRVVAETDRHRGGRSGREGDGSRR